MNLILRLVIAAIALAGTCLGTPPHSRLDINRLYSLPWIIGTAPQDFIWSADSRRVAFLWNDQGIPFRDVWIASVEARSPRQVTVMPRSAIPTSPENDLQKLQQAADAEMDLGVSHVIWSPDQQQLLFVFKSQLYTVFPGSQPELLVDQKNVSVVKSAPKGEKLLSKRARTSLWRL